MIVGSWELEAPVGAGAMASVWRALHQSNRRPAAVKLIAPSGGGVRWTIDLLNEARILAAVDHPNVIDVLDYGMTESTVSEVPAGSVWIATELAERSLAGWSVDWPQLHAILRQVLAGLARAHAVGIVHRDIKPGNILMFHGGRGSAWKVADFGLALRQGIDTDGPAGGTPGFMAPEQITGNLADQGPWTDLYAVGCMGWQLATGVGPHDAPTVQDTLRSHMRGILPGFAPRFEVPTGLEGWLRRMIQPVPAHRLKRAADALVLLRQVADGPMRPAALSEATANDSVSLADTLLPSQEMIDAGPEPTFDLPASEAVELPDPLALHAAALDRVQQLPLSPPPQDRSAALSRVRATPLVGRERECAVLWQALRGAVRARKLQVVTIRGASGMGRTRLARWLLVHAHEAGLTESFVAPSGGDRLGGLVRGVLGLGAQPTRSQANNRLSSRLGLKYDPVLARVLADRAVGEPDPEDAALLAPGLSALADGRAALVVFDDAEDDPDVLAWIHRSAGWTGDPIFVVVCLTDGTPGATETAEALKAMGALTIPLGPIDVDAQSSLLRQRFGLAPDVAAIAAGHAGGVPALAVELVEAWWQRHLLTRGPQGWEATDLDALDISMEITDAWRNRLTELFDEPGSATRVSVGIAALLGSEIAEDDWVAACRAFGVEPSWAAMLGLANQDYVSRDETGWTWRSEPARLALRRVLAPSERTRAAAACVEVIDPRASPIRHGQLLIQADRAEQAIGPLLDAAWTAANDRRNTAALAALDAVVLARRQLGRTEVDDDALRERLYRSKVLFRMGRAAEAEELMDLVMRATAHRQDDLRADVVIQAALHVAQSGQTQHTLELLQEVIARLRTEGDTRRLVVALGNASALYSELGDLNSALQAMREALSLRPSAWGYKHSAAFLARLGNLDEALAELHEADELAADNPTSRAEVLSMLGHLLDRRGDPEGGRAKLVESYEISLEYGETLHAADSLNNIAEIDRRQGRLDDAEAGYLESLELFRRVGRKVHPILIANLALVYVERGKWAQAWETFSGCIDELREQSRASWVGVVIGLAMPSVHDQPTLWDALLAERLRLLESTGHSDRDCVRMLRLSADRWRESGDEGRRRKALEAALTEARASAMQDHIDEIEALLADD